MGTHKPQPLTLSPPRATSWHLQLCVAKHFINCPAPACSYLPSFSIPPTQIQAHRTAGALNPWPEGCSNCPASPMVSRGRLLPGLDAPCILCSQASIPRPSHLHSHLDGSQQKPGWPLTSANSQLSLVFQHGAAPP